MTFERFPKFRAIATPLVLWPWFAVMAGHGVLDVLNDLGVFSDAIDFGIKRASELIEMMIGVTATMYMWLNRRTHPRFSQVSSPVT